jgi:hypothetical protein
LLRKNLLQKKLKSRFLVTTIAGVPFSGILMAADADYYSFVDVKAHQDHEIPRTAPGELFILQSNVAYLQLVTDVSG